MATQDMTVSLYNGAHTITYRNGNHKYYIENKSLPSVTTIMGKILAKPDLMLWPLNLALQYLTDKLPNITSEDLAMARTAHVRRREGGANTGTAVHYLAEQRLRMPISKRLVLDPEKLPEEVVMASLAFETWFIQTRPRVIAIEQIVYSPTLEYVGTYDSILNIDGKVCLCDIKTTNASKVAPKGVYPEHFIQMGAYYAAYEEQRIYEHEHGGTELKPIEDFVVISVKKTGSIDTMSASKQGIDIHALQRSWYSIMDVYAQIDRLKNQIGAAL